MILATLPSSTRETLLRLTYQAISTPHTVLVQFNNLIAFGFSFSDK